MCCYPSDFEAKFRTLLADRADAFFQSLAQPSVQGLRVNLCKTSANAFLAHSGLSLTSVPWCAEGFYVENPAQRPGKHPYHEAGVYYLQDPSAMAPVTLLAPREGDRVLDLCAAPGGKSTQIAALIGADGFLLANEIHPQRSRQLSQNIERMGFANTIVSNESPAHLAARLPGFFDKVLVDAPCSGEGMFRKNQEARQHWSANNVLFCHDRQLEILAQAAIMLRPGGRLVYSTCTFSPEEDEQTIVDFLSQHPEFEIEEQPALFFDAGQPSWAHPALPQLVHTHRLWPHRQRGEGHFVAVLRKSASAHLARAKAPSGKWGSKMPPAYAAFADQFIANAPSGPFLLFGEHLYQPPCQAPSLDGLKILRPGLHLGRIVKNRFEPSHALSHCLMPKQARTLYTLTPDGPEAERYLRGDALPFDQGKSWCLVCVGCFPLGWGKASDGQLKNHFPKGLRWL